MSAFYPALAIPLFLLLVERQKTVMMLYFTVCVVTAGWDGLAVGSVYWVVFAFARLIFDTIGAFGRSREL